MCVCVPRPARKMKSRKVMIWHLGPSYIVASRSEARGTRNFKQMIKFVSRIHGYATQCSGYDKMLCRNADFRYFQSFGNQQWQRNDPLIGSKNSKKRVSMILSLRVDSVVCINPCYLYSAIYHRCSRRYPHPQLIAILSP